MTNITHITTYTPVLLLCDRCRLRELPHSLQKALRKVVLIWPEQRLMGPFHRGENQGSSGGEVTLPWRRSQHTEWALVPPPMCCPHSTLSGSSHAHSSHPTTASQSLVLPVAKQLRPTPCLPADNLHLQDPVSCERKKGSTESSLRAIYEPVLSS